jgi:hypothetical protein
MKYLLNSAVITGPGTYRYRLISHEEARDWIRRNAGAVESRIGYAQTAEYIRRELGFDCPISREAITMNPGDEALVVRLRYRLDDPGLKSQQPTFPPDAWEIGLLECSLDLDNKEG